MHRHAYTQEHVHEERLKLHSQTHRVINQVHGCVRTTGHTNARLFFQQREMYPTDNHRLLHLDTSGVSAGSLNVQKMDTVFSVSCVTSQTHLRYKLD